MLARSLPHLVSEANGLNEDFLADLEEGSVKFPGLDTRTGMDPTCAAVLGGTCDFRYRKVLHAHMCMCAHVHIVRPRVCTCV